MHTPERRLNFADWGRYTVPAGQTVRAGMPIVLDATDTNGSEDYVNAREATAATSVVFAIAKGDPGTSYAAGEQFDALHIFSVVQWARVGTGGATRGSRAVATTDGLTNAAAHGTAARVHSPGIFLATGVAGDFVAIGIAPSSLSTA
jgi:hypothetical protein